MKCLNALNIPLLIITTLIISGCGGGGGGDLNGKLLGSPKPVPSKTPTTPTSPATPTNSPSPKTSPTPSAPTVPPTGGGGTSRPPESPVPQPSFTPVNSAIKPVSAAEATFNAKAIKTFEFTWQDVDDANYYKLLEDADGASGYTPVKTNIPQGAQLATLYVPLHKRTNARYILESCNQHGCTQSEQITVESNLADAIGYFKANRSQESVFGGAVDISANGKIMAISEPRFTTESGERVNGDGKISIGAVNIYENIDNVWQHKALLYPKNLSPSDKFGSVISLSDDGKTLAVGVADEDSNAKTINGDEKNNDLSNSGAVFIYTSSNGDWRQQAYIKPGNSIRNGYFGLSLSLSEDGDQLAVAANKSTDINTSSVYIYNRSNSTWQQNTIISGSAEQSNTFMVSAIALSADATTLAIGDTSESSAATGVDGNKNIGTSSESGAVYIYTKKSGESNNSNQWQQQAYIKASNTDESDFFGTNLSLSKNGHVLAVGAPFEDSNSQSINSSQNNNSAEDSGAAYVFTRSSNKWQQQAYLKASNTYKGNLFGAQLRLSADGTSLVVSSLDEDSDAIGISDRSSSSKDASASGAAYLFSRESGSWKEQRYIKASNTERSDRFSSRLTISADGNTIVVSASGEDSNATGLGGDQKNNSTFQTGAVYIY